MTAPADAIRARRRMTNRFIAEHKADRLGPFLHPDVNLIGGEGGLLMGREAVLAAFARQFADPEFVAYVRTPATIEIDQDGSRAAEQGAWTGSWNQATGPLELSGRYLAVWRKVTGQWVIEQELYVTLARSG